MTTSPLTEAVDTVGFDATPETANDPVMLSETDAGSRTLSYVRVMTELLAEAETRTGAVMSTVIDSGAEEDEYSPAESMFCVVIE